MARYVVKAWVETDLTLEEAEELIRRAFIEDRYFLEFDLYLVPKEEVI